MTVQDFKFFVAFGIIIPMLLTSTMLNVRRLITLHRLKPSWSLKPWLRYPRVTKVMLSMSYLTMISALSVSSKPESGIIERAYRQLYAIPIMMVFDYLLLLFYVGFLIVTGYVCLLLANRYGRVRRIKQKRGESYLAMWKVVIIAMGAAPIIPVGLAFSLMHLFAYIESNKVFLGVLVTALLSLGLYVLKLKVLLTYAVAEIVFALGVCGSTVAAMEDLIKPVQLVGLFSSVYLIIRGLDNLRKGIKDREALTRTL